jgi:hypothetical protein
MGKTLDRLDSLVAFDMDFTKGHLRERKTGLTAGATLPARLVKDKGRWGVRVSSAGRITYADNAAFRLDKGQGTLLAFVDLQSNAGGRVYSKRAAGGTSVDFQTLPAGISIYDGATSSGLTTDVNRANMVGFTFVNGQKPRGYVDGSFRGLFAADINIATDTAPVEIGNIFTTTNPLGNTIHRIVGFDSVLSDADIAAIYDEQMREASQVCTFPALSAPPYPLPPTETHRPLIETDCRTRHGRNLANLGTGGSAYDFLMDDGINRPRPVYVEDGKGGGMAFNGTDNSIKTASNVTEMSGATKVTVEMVWEPNAVPSNDYLLAWNASAGVGDFFGIQIDGQSLSPITANSGSAFGTRAACVFPSATQHVVVQYDGTKADNANRLQLFIDSGLRGVSYTGTVPASLPAAASPLCVMAYSGLVNNTSGTLRSFRMWVGNVPTAEENLRRYLSWARRQTNDFMRNVPVTTSGYNYLHDTQWRAMGSGKLITFDGTRKRMENTFAAGQYTTPSEQNAGTWYFRFFDKVLSSETYLNVFSDIPATSYAAANGYFFYVFGDGSIGLLRATAPSSAGVIQTAAGFIQADTEYEICVTRSADGFWNMFIRGGAYVVWNPCPNVLGTFGIDRTHWRARQLSAFHATVGDYHADIRHFQGAIDPRTQDLPI